MATLVRLGIAAAALGVTLAAHARITAPEPTAPAAPDVAPATGRTPGFGFDALVADYWWLRAVQIVGHEEADLIGSAPAVGQLVERVVALDPFVDHPYRFAALWMVNHPDQVRAANRILERGIAYHPLEWRNRFYLAFNHFFFLGDAETAARELEAAIGLYGAPRYLGRLLARLRFQNDGLEVAGAFVEELRRNTDDPWKQAEYEKALDEIETERRARLLDRARESFLDRNGRDIERVEELAEGPGAVLPALPPDLHGWGWVLDPESGKIESAYYGHRYRLHMHETDRKRLEEWEASGALAPGQEDAG